MLAVWEDHIAGWDWWAAGGWRAHLTTTLYTSSPPESLGLRASRMRPIRALRSMRSTRSRQSSCVCVCVCMCVCVCERSRTSVLLLFVTSVFDMSHSGSHFYIGVGPSSIFPGKERKERGREGEREREGSRQGRQGGRRYRVARLGSNGSEERRGRAIAPQSISSTEGGERGSRREVFRDNIYVPVV